MGGGGLHCFQSEGTHLIVMSFTPPFCRLFALKKGLQKGGGVTGTPEAPSQLSPGTVAWFELTGTIHFFTICQLLLFPLMTLNTDILILLYFFFYLVMLSFFRVQSFVLLFYSYLLHIKYCSQFRRFFWERKVSYFPTAYFFIIVPWFCILLLLLVSNCRVQCTLVVLVATQIL